MEKKENKTVAVKGIKNSTEEKNVVVITTKLSMKDFNCSPSKYEIPVPIIPGYFLG